MVLPIIKIGNSKGIRLSKSILEAYGFSDKVCLELEKERIVMTPIKRVREGWNKAFKRMHENRHDILIE